MSDFSINLTRADPPDNTMGSPASAAPDIWGRVYQNYISVNLNSENLAKGAYDAYNLLTTGNLSKLVGDTFDYIQEVEGNVENLADSVATRVSTESNRVDMIRDGLNGLFKREAPSQDADKSRINSAKNALGYPISDKYPDDSQGSTVTTYDLSFSRTIPLAKATGANSFVPGFIKGRRAAQLGKLIGNIFTSQALSGFYLDDKPEEPALESNQPMTVLVYQVNKLQEQIVALEEKFNKLLTNTSDDKFSINTLYVKQIRFVSTDATEISVGTHKYLDYDKFTMPTTFTNGDN